MPFIVARRNSLGSVASAQTTNTATGMAMIAMRVERAARVTRGPRMLQCSDPASEAGGKGKCEAEYFPHPRSLSRGEREGNLPSPSGREVCRAPQPACVQERV